MDGWHHRLSGYLFEQAPGDGKGQGSLVFCSPWGRKELDMTERLNNNNKESKKPQVSSCLLTSFILNSVLETRYPSLVQEIHLRDKLLEEAAPLCKKKGRGMV